MYLYFSEQADLFSLFCWGPDILLRGGFGSRSFSRLSNGKFINDVWV